MNKLSLTTLSKYLIIVLQIGILTLYSFIGTLIAEGLHLTIPGSMIGLILLFLTLYFKILPVKMIQNGAGFLLSLLALFFIPATVGVMNYPELASFHGLLLLLAVILSTLFTLIVSAKVCQYIEDKKTEKEEV